MATLLPISAIVPTRDRPQPLSRMLHSLAAQSAQPAELVVVDASTDAQTCYERAIAIGAAVQRNQAVAAATQPYILFCDDDIWFEPDCISRLWQALQRDPALGGINAMITNQRYLPPGRVSRLLFRVLHGQAESSYAGRCIGPGLNLLPEDRPDLPAVVPMEWLNTTCTLYRREVLPQPPFSVQFTGYSLFEDLTLSLTVGKRWQLANGRTARIFHDSQPGEHKNHVGAVAKMELVNRHYVMTQVLQRRHWQDYGKLALLQLFGIAASLVSVAGWRSLPALLWGKLQGMGAIAAAAISRPNRSGQPTARLE
jgi:glycosyltransferase involved in cell wall biosynthesis